MNMQEIALSLALLGIWLGVMVLLPAVASIISYAIAGWVIGSNCSKAVVFLLRREKI
jgi:uncharacterized membrane protein AbrB (regulator of aidB expression)